jgi:hypothetical protein
MTRAFVYNHELFGSFDDFGFCLSTVGKGSPLPKAYSQQQL